MYHSHLYIIRGVALHIHRVDGHLVRHQAQRRDSASTRQQQVGVEEDDGLVCFLILMKHWMEPGLDVMAPSQILPDVFPGESVKAAGRLFGRGLGTVVKCKEMQRQERVANKLVDRWRNDQFYDGAALKGGVA